MVKLNYYMRFYLFFSLFFLTTFCLFSQVGIQLYSSITTGAQQTELYLPLLKNKIPISKPTVGIIFMSTKDKKKNRIPLFSFGCLNRDLDTRCCVFDLCRFWLLNIVLNLLFFYLYSNWITRII